MAIGKHQSSRSKSVVWLTPPAIIHDLGVFDLDPCAAPPPRPWETAREHIALPEDGLAADWSGRVWMNPPYGTRPVISPWMRKIARHGVGTALIFARTETEVFFETVWNAATALLFIEGRLHFHRPDGSQAEENGGAPSVLVAYGQLDADALAASNIPGAFVPLQLPRVYAVAALSRTWREAVVEWAKTHDGPILVSDLYRAFSGHPKARRNPNWKAKLRQTLQRGGFERVGPEQWALPL